MKNIPHFFLSFPFFSIFPQYPKTHCEAIFQFAKCNVYFAYHCINKTQNRCRKSWIGHSSIRLLWIWYNLIMIQAKFGHFHRLQKRPSADIYKCVTYIRTVPEFVHSINFFFFFIFFPKKYPTRLGLPNESPQWKILGQFCKWFKNNLY